MTFSVISGPVSISGNSLSITGAGMVTISASQVGNENYNSATDVLQSFEISKADQAISFAELDDKTFGDAAFDLSASASSGLDVIFSLVSGPTTISENTVTITGAGAVTIAANQGGNSNYNSANEVHQSFDIAKADQIITINAIDDKLITDVPFDVVAQVDSDLVLEYEVAGPASISDVTITLDGSPGEVTITVTQVGNENYNSAIETISFDVLEEAVLNVSDVISIQVYPNPVLNILSIESDEQVELSIYNMKGMMLKSATITSGEIDVSDLASGIYLLKAVSEKQSITKKLIKAN